MNEKANTRTDGKYPYKLVSLMTKKKKEIKDKFDLPPSSRKHYY